MTLLDLLLRPVGQVPIAAAEAVTRVTAAGARVELLPAKQKRRRWHRTTRAEREAAKDKSDAEIRAGMQAFAESLRADQSELLGPWNPPGVEPSVEQKAGAP